MGSEFTVSSSSLTNSRDCCSCSGDLVETFCDAKSGVVNGIVMLPEVVFQLTFVLKEPDGVSIGILLLEGDCLLQTRFAAACSAFSGSCSNATQLRTSGILVDSSFGGGQGMGRTVARLSRPGRRQNNCKKTRQSTTIKVLEIFLHHMQLIF